MDAGARSVHVLDKGRASKAHDVVKLARPERAFMLHWLFLVADPAVSTKAKRGMILDFVESVEDGGSWIIEAGSGRNTLNRKERRTMISDALEAVTKMRQPGTRRSLGRPTRQFTPEEWATAERLWRGRDVKSWDEFEVRAPEGFRAMRAWRIWKGREE